MHAVKFLEAFCINAQMSLKSCGNIAPKEMFLVLRDLTHTH